MATLGALVGLLAPLVPGLAAIGLRLIVRDVMDYKLDRAAMNNATPDQKVAVVRARYAARRRTVAK